MQKGRVIVVTDSPRGDTGKGRKADQLLGDERIKCSFRWQGGGNAGHTVVVGDKSVDVHMLPSSLVRNLERPELKSVMAGGVLLDMPGFKAEIDHLRKFGIETNPENLSVSGRCQLTLPFHRALEAGKEDSNASTGTTKKAIAQTYGFQTMYMGIQAQDLVNLDHFREMVLEPLSWANAVLTGKFLRPAVELDEVMAEAEAYRGLILPFLVDDIGIFNAMLERGDWLLAEGAQSAILCNKLGINRHTTASHTWSGSIQASAGIHPSWIKQHHLVIKAYDTSVGKHPLISVMEDDIAKIVQQRGGEKGVTSGRLRDVLWPDHAIARYVVQIGRPTHLAINKVDVLVGLPLKVCVGYELNGRRIDVMPTSPYVLAQCKPIYEEYPAWEEDITGITSWNDLPPNAKEYLIAVARPYVDDPGTAKLDMIGTGPERDQLIEL